MNYTGSREELKLESFKDNCDFLVCICFLFILEIKSSKSLYCYGLFNF